MKKIVRKSHEKEIAYKLSKKKLLRQDWEGGYFSPPPVQIGLRTLPGGGSPWTPLNVMVLELNLCCSLLSNHELVDIRVVLHRLYAHTMDRTKISINLVIFFNLFIFIKVVSEAQRALEF